MNEVYRDIEQHLTGLRRYAGALAHDPAAADDLVQDCVAKALAKSHLYKPGTNLRAWLFTILRNQHISDIRRSVRTGVPVDPDDAQAALATRPNQENGLAVSSLARALRKLPDGQRRLIELVALDGQSYEDVARAHGLALGTVKSRISRGRDQLRRTLEGHVECEAPGRRAWAEHSTDRANGGGGPFSSREDVGGLDGESSAPAAELSRIRFDGRRAALAAGHRGGLVRPGQVETDRGAPALGTFDAQVAAGLLGKTRLTSTSTQYPSRRSSSGVSGARP